ncbi:hypothetical protein UFOVP831_16 [uncultured Caudovirales phage]|uniref:Uncharacterized protein n=1 Tax=uncultured Caudovirales phage TaxID=2100421 RepID=A0A6J5P4H8_9CAUD|nr:hypothetical protein UFOVP831_16 [uncultured Caudovirales phage]
MGLVYVALFLLQIPIFSLIIFVYLDLEKVKAKQNADHQHLLNNLKQLINLLPHEK